MFSVNGGGSGQGGIFTTSFLQPTTPKTNERLLLLSNAYILITRVFSATLLCERVVALRALAVN